MIEPNPRRAVQNLNTFQAIPAPDLYILLEREKNRGTPPQFRTKRLFLYALGGDPRSGTRQQLPVAEQAESSMSSNEKTRDRIWRCSNSGGKEKIKVFFFLRESMVHAELDGKLGTFWA